MITYQVRVIVESNMAMIVSQVMDSLAHEGFKLVAQSNTERRTYLDYERELATQMDDGRKVVKPHNRRRK